MGANVRMVNTDTVFTYDGASQRIQAGTLIDVPAGSALETAIGVGNLTSLSVSQDTIDAGGDTPPDDPDAGGGTT
jgi:hypothetical protein